MRKISLLALFSFAMSGIASAAFQPPVLPSVEGTGASAPWGGTDAGKRLIEAHLANAAAAAMNHAWARGDRPDDVIVAVPLKMLTTGPNENGDGQLNATVSFESWAGQQSDHTILPPLVATLLKMTGEADRIVFALAPGALSGETSSLTIRYANDAGTRVQMNIPVPSARELEWPLPGDLTLDAPIARKTILVSLDGAKSWLPLLFHIPIREIGELTSPPTVPGSGPSFMDSVPKEFLSYKDGHYILDHENVSAARHAGDPAVPYDRLKAKQAATDAHKPGGFSIPYGIHLEKEGLHDRIPSTPGGTVNNDDPSSYITVSVGDFWNWTPFSNDQNLLQPLSVHYLCLDKRIPSLESAKNGGVTSGANWHRVHLDFTRSGGMDVPLGGSESFFNDLENRSMFVGYATANANIDPPPGGTYSFGLSDVATFRLVRPGEVFITPNSGSVVSGGKTVDQSVFHAVFAYQPDSPACVEVWTPPCTPNSAFGFSCGTTPVDIEVKSAVLPAGTKLSFKGNAEYAINVADRPFIHKMSVAGPVSNDVPQALTPFSTGPGVQTWRAHLDLPQSMLIEYEIDLQAPGSAQPKKVSSSSFAVPIASGLTINVPGQVTEPAKELP